MMHIPGYNLWEKTRANFWLIPLLMVLCAIGLSLVTIAWDRSLDHGQDGDIAFSIWKGGATVAMRLLSTIAGSVITMTGVVFSITLVSLSITSSQYGSKVLRNFMRDIVTQLVIGTFVSTSVYCLLVLRTIHTGSQTFVPDISIMICLGLALTSLMLLIYFIHHLSVRVQASDIIYSVAKDLIALIQTSLTDADKLAQIKPENIEPFEGEAITASTYGYLQIIDYNRLIKIAKREQTELELFFRPGNFINMGDRLAVFSKKGLPEQVIKETSKAFILGREKSPAQDIEYAIEQLVAVAIRALGVNANDTFAANSCVDHLGAALSELCYKQLSPSYYPQNDWLHLASKRVTYEGLTDAAFYQIRQYGSKAAPVLIHLLEVLLSIMHHTRTREQRAALIKHALIIKKTADQFLEENDRRDMQERFEKFEQFSLSQRFEA